MNLASSPGLEKKRKASNKATVMAAKQTMTRRDEDPFTDRLVGFSCGSWLGETLISSFGDAWFEEARCKLVDKEKGHIVGKVMRRTNIKDKKSSPHIAYDIAWEYSYLGESSVRHSYLVDACHVGSRIFTFRTSTNTSESQPVLRTSPHTRQSQPVSRTSTTTSEAQPVSRTSARTRQSQPVSRTSAPTSESQPVLMERIKEVSDRQQRNRKFIMEKYRLALNDILDEDSSMGVAPVSNQSSDSKSSNDNFAEWLIFGQEE
jgi:hypothetical protein